MKYSGIFQRTANITKCATLILDFFQYFYLSFLEYGVFKNYGSTRFLFLEYGTFQESGNKLTFEIGEIWKTNRIFLKIVKQSKYQKFWIMEYSIKYSWNIQKIVKQATGA